eukprot:8712912-Heterocapsa_arctica.AAC.1
MESRSCPHHKMGPGGVVGDHRKEQPVGGLDLAPNQGLLDECLASSQASRSLSQALEQHQGPHSCHVPVFGKDRLVHEWALRLDRRPWSGEADDRMFASNVRQTAQAGCAQESGKE